MAHYPANRKTKTARDRSRRVLSQNFLVDPDAVRQVIRAARPGPRDLIVEAGAGRGQLTRPLAAECRRVLAYEIDPYLIDELTANCAGLTNVSCLSQDFLTARAPEEPFAVVANVPWALTARVVDWCLRAPALTSATLLTQLEYARKRAGDYGRWSQLTVGTWPQFEWRLAGRVPRTTFRPVPRVDAGLLRLERRARPLLPPGDLAAYRNLVDLGFSGVGGSLYASLRRRYPQRRLHAAFRAARLPQDLAVGFVWPEQWLALFRLLHH
ncbi:MAG TPA: ErmE/ErmH/ErmO/ErmR family 23S rRNA (adenine(2058)-N(6))-methyltransferase [Micromonosporaceae bacterium]|nr:ErmE/ErmH/ErmO/ErmR family 23S rRNA (adenine(2058)-N(6))-methyltransferase [Micromonosporaceae bacterium]